MRAHLWVGWFESKELFDDYVAEQYGEDERTVPLSRFAGDQGQDWYDHDWFEFYTDQPAQDLARHIANASPAPEATEALAALDLNSMIICIADGDYSVIDDPRSCRGEGYELVYVGTLPWG